MRTQLTWHVHCPPQTWRINYILLSCCFGGYLKRALSGGEAETDGEKSEFYSQNIVMAQPIAAPAVCCTRKCRCACVHKWRAKTRWRLPLQSTLIQMATTFWHLFNSHISKKFTHLLFFCFQWASALMYSTENACSKWRLRAEVKKHCSHSFHLNKFHFSATMSATFPFFFFFLFFWFLFVKAEYKKQHKNRAKALDSWGQGWEGSRTAYKRSIWANKISGTHMWHATWKYWKYWKYENDKYQ